MPAVSTAPTSNTLAIRGLLDRLFRKKPGRPPALHEPTNWLGVRNALLHPPTQEDFFTTAALNYVCGVALFFEAGDGRVRPACTLAHVAAAVSLVDQDAVLSALAGDANAARLVQYLHDARSAGAHQQVAGILPEAQALVAPLFQQVDAASRECVRSYFASIA